MHFAIIYSNGPAHRDDDTRNEQIIYEHVKHQQGLHKAGKLVMGGPFTDGTGGMAVLEVDSEEEARETVENDPAVISKHYTITMHPYRIALKQ